MGLMQLSTENGCDETLISLLIFFYTSILNQDLKDFVWIKDNIYQLNSVCSTSDIS